MIFFANLMPRFLYLALLVCVTSSASSFPLGEKLPTPSLVSAGRFNLSPYAFSEATQVVIFFYSASWCAPCKPMAEALKKIYPEWVADTKGLELVTYSVDRSPRARADYLRETRFDWPAISPEVIDRKPWLTKIPEGTPSFQAFRIEDTQLVAITEVDDAEPVFKAAVQQLTHGGLKSSF